MNKGDISDEEVSGDDIKKFYDKKADKRDRKKTSLEAREDITFEEKVPQDALMDFNKVFEMAMMRLLDKRHRKYLCHLLRQKNFENFLNDKCLTKLTKEIGVDECDKGIIPEKVIAKDLGFTGEIYKEGREFHRFKEGFWHEVKSQRCGEFEALLKKDE